MAGAFFRQPILNSPYDYPSQHWEIDGDGQPTHQVIDKRRRTEFLTPIPQPKRQSGAGGQKTLDYGDGQGISSEAQQYEHAAIINGVRAFGTQLLCEQVVGRALRRESYETGENGLLAPSYADILGIPSTLPPSRWSRRPRSRPAPCGFMPCARSATRWKSGSRTSPATASICRRKKWKPSSPRTRRWNSRWV